MNLTKDGMVEKLKKKYLGEGGKKIKREKSF
jgi:hypothetical protein